MATTIVTKSGSGAPTASDLVAGELAVDLTNGRLYTEDSGGTVLELGLNPNGNVNVTGSVTADSLATDDDVSGISTLGRYSSGFAYSLVRPTATATGIEIRTNAGNALAHFLNDGTTTLHHNGSAKLTTLSTGIDVTGSGTFSSTAAEVAKFTSSDAGTTITLNNTHANAWGSNIAFQTQGTAAGFVGAIGSLIGSTDQTLAVYGAAGNGVGIYTNGNNERVKVTSAGNVGIGVSAPNEKLESSGAIRVLGVTATSANSGTLSFNGTLFNIESRGPDTSNRGTIGFYQATSNGSSAIQSMLLDASGNLLVGTTGHFDYSGSTTEVTVGTSATGANAGGAVTFVSNNGGTTLGYIGFQESEAAVGTMGTRPLKFTTNNTEAMRIDSSGNLLVGTTDTSLYNNTSGGGAAFMGVGDGIRLDLARDGDVATFNRMSTTGPLLEMRQGGGYVGDISVTASTTSYNTSSDQRLKENIADADDAGSKIDSIQVRKYDWKADGSHQDYGMIAQELLEVAPEAVSAPEDPEEMMGVDYSKLVPMMLKEIQSLRARINALEAE